MFSTMKSDRAKRSYTNQSKTTTAALRGTTTNPYRKQYMKSRRARWKRTSFFFLFPRPSTGTVTKEMKERSRKKKKKKAKDKEINKRTLK